MSVVDASVWVSFFVSADTHHEVSLDWLERQFDEQGLLVGPDFLLAEVAGAIARRSGRARMGVAAIERMLGLPELELFGTDRQLCLNAARLAADLRLRGADAIYVATAQMLGLPLITWDSELLERAAPAVEVREPR